MPGLVWGGHSCPPTPRSPRSHREYEDLKATALAAEVLMAAPARGKTGPSVYFITASTFQKQCLFQSERLTKPFIETLLAYRIQRKYLLHEFVVMPNHFHLLIKMLMWGQPPIACPERSRRGCPVERSSTGGAGASARAFEV